MNKFANGFVLLQFILLAHPLHLSKSKIKAVHYDGNYLEPVHAKQLEIHLTIENDLLFLRCQEQNITRNIIVVPIRSGRHRSHDVFLSYSLMTAFYVQPDALARVIVSDDFLKRRRVIGLKRDEIGAYALTTFGRSVLCALNIIQNKMAALREQHPFRSYYMQMMQTVKKSVLHHSRLIDRMSAELEETRELMESAPTATFMLNGHAQNIWVEMRLSNRTLHNRVSHCCAIL